MNKRFIIILVFIVLLVSGLTLGLYKKFNNSSLSSSKEVSNNNAVENVSKTSSASNKGVSAGQSANNTTNIIAGSSSKSINSVDDMNSLSNYINGGLIRYDNPYLFVTTSEAQATNSPLLCSLEDGTTMFKKLNINDAIQLTTTGGDVFYKTGSTTMLMKANLNTGEHTMLVNQCGSYFIYNSYIYYWDLSDKTIKKMNISGDSISILKRDIFKGSYTSEGLNSDIFVANNKLYFSTIEVSGEGNDQKWKTVLYSMNLDGSEFSSVFEDIYQQYIFSDNCLYYIKLPMDSSSYQKLIKYDLSNKKSSVLFEASSSFIDSLNLYKGNLYFLTSKSGKNIIAKYNIETNKISYSSSTITTVGRLFILNDRIFVMPLGIADNNPYLYYSIKIDGSEEKCVK